MSVSDGTDSQCCETTTEPYGVAMGDVLAKGYYNDDEKLKTASEQSTDDSEDEDSRLSSERQAADGAPDALDDISSSTNLSRLANTIVDDLAENVNSDDTSLRIDAQVANLTSAESTCTATEHSLDCSYAVCPNDCSQHPDSFCPCDTCKLCKLKRAMIDDELKREIRWHRLWTELRDHIRSVFEAALEATIVPNTVPYQCDPCRLSQLRENVVQMCKRNSQQLLLMLIVQAQEFVVELKNRIKETLHDNSLTNVAEIFLTRILDGYDAFVSTAKQVSDLVKPVEERHLLKFNLTWEFFNKALYENHIWISEPSMRNVTGSFTTQLTKSRKRHSYQALFERYVAFVAEMMRVAELWPETERLIVKWNDKQTADRSRASNLSPVDSSDVSSSTDIVPRSQDKCEGSNEEEIAERTLRSLNSVSHSLSNGTRVNASTETNGREHHFSSLSPITRAAKAIARKDFNPEDRKGLLKKRASTGSIANNPLHELDIALRHKTDIVQEIANDLSESMDREPERQMCQCIYEHMREIDETGRTWWSDSPCLCVLNLRWLCGVSKACPCLSTAPTTNMIANERPESPTSTTPTTTPVKQTRHSTTQTANSLTLDSATVEEEEEAPTNGPLTSTATTTTTTTTTPNSVATTTHNHNHNPPHQGSTHTHFHGASTDSTKSTGPSHRPHNHNNHALHIYRKHAKVEEIKRILCNDLSPGDGDCSDSGSSQEDSCSTSSSTPRDSSRHCDCCYCEVFGPGLPSVAPVSRNYNEMRERLRQLLTKKKAKKCKAPCSPPKSPAESSIASSTSTDHKATPPLRSAPSRSNTPIPVVATAQPEQRDQRDLEALLEFIEGNQGTKKDNKKTEKKARQKQRKLDEMLRKEKEEADKQKLIELQKQTPDVTITVVDPLKPMGHRFRHRNLPEVSILPATITPVPMIIPQKQANTSKKKEKQAQKQQQKQDKLAEKTVHTNSGKSKNTPINMNVYDYVVRDSAPDKTKRGGKSDSGKNVKAAISKNEKVQNVAPAPAPILPPANETTDVKLTKKERKKLRREIKKLEEAKEKEAKVVTSADSKPQIVTIKRVMESNNAEPTVTITLKGQTPAEDKVLFTLVNGQTKDPGAAKTEQQQQQGQPTSGKKKKGKGNSGGNQNQTANQTQQPAVKVQPVAKQQTLQKGNDSKAAKQQQQQQANSEKSKGKKCEEKKVLQESQQSNIETKSTKSKKDKKNGESKQTVVPPTTAKSKNSQTQQQQKPQQQPTQQSAGKKQSKAKTTQQIPAAQKSQQNTNTPSENGKKKSKDKQQRPTEQNAQANVAKSKKKPETTANNKKQPAEKESQKNRTKSNQVTIQQQKSNDEATREAAAERHNSLLSNQLKDFGPTTRINIENLKLPPGITITKVDAPVKSFPIKSVPMPKPVTAAKQTTIIAAPMSGVQSSYSGPQTAGNVIVVDTGKLKHDLLPKNNDKSKESQKDAQTGSTAGSGKKKKKKKKGKNSAVVGSGTSLANAPNRVGNDSGKETGDESAKIVHNPGSNMITIRNPAFSPAPKIDTTPQAAIIKVAENGMVTIRSPALQQAINAGLTPPSQPDFIVKGSPSLSNNNSSVTSNRATLTTSDSTSHKNTSGAMLSPSLAEFRNRLTADCTSLPGLANIHISKVTSGQPIPERGINLRGTSVTLTKVRSPDAPISTSPLNSKTINTTSIEEVQQAKTAVREAINATINVPATSSKGKKKKKRGNGTKHSGDDWNLVESVFTPKDIDLEDGEMDDAERELEAFKRFCLQSVPPPRKEKVNLNIKDIVLKKKSSSSSSSSSSSGGAAAPVIAAN